MKMKRSNRSKNIEKQDEIREVIVEKQSGFNLLEVVIIMIITIAFGGVAGALITYLSLKSPSTTIINENSATEFNEFIKVYNTLSSNYYGEIDQKELISSGIKGMIDYLGDPYSEYYSKEEANSLTESLTGSYIGIGSEIAVLTTGEVLVSAVYEGSPADIGGLQPEDKILKINDQDVTAENAAALINTIKGTKGQKVTVVVKRNEEEVTCEITTDVIVKKSVYSTTYEKNSKKVGYIQISVFADNTDNQFKEALTNLQTEGIDSLIIDVRYNTGGHLDVVTNIVSNFLNKDKVIYQLENKGLKEPIYSKGTSTLNIPVVVLANTFSASASEILAAALQESYGAKVIGTATYGKGTVQQTMTLSSGATIKYTVQKWLTPNGTWINEVGVTPNIEVELEEGYFNEPTEANDNQLQTALDELTKETAQ